MEFRTTNKSNEKEYQKYRNKLIEKILYLYNAIQNPEKNDNINEIESILSVKNYDQNKDFSMTEGEILTFFYEDIYNIEQELITLLTFVNNQKNKDV